MDKPRYFQKDTYHHLYNRGANKGLIFLDEYDYRYFQKRILFYKQKYEIEILAYCLMPNHFHIFIHQTTSEGPGNKFIGDFTNSYTKSFNKKYDHSGVIFEGRTKSKIVYDEKSFTCLVKYILLNPVKAGLVKKFCDWKYSSARELTNRIEDSITDKIILSYFKSTEKFIEFIEQEDSFNLPDDFILDNDDTR